MSVPAAAEPAVPSRNSSLDYHAARLLLLLAAFGDSDEGGIDGLTKLAKLDFLLRYPALMEELAHSIRSPVPSGVQPTSTERLAVESRMVRYKYGPWDDRYYPIIGILLGTGLATSKPGRGRIALMITQKGIEVADQLARDPAWRLVAQRCEYLRQRFDLSGSQLKNLIYENLPSVVDRPHRTSI